MYEKRMSDQINNGNSNGSSLISHNTKIVGEIRGDKELIFSGQFEGKINLTSFLFLKSDGKIKGTIEADNIVVEGNIEGDIVARQKIEIRARGVFNGNVVCKQIAIEEGAFFQGEVRMDDGSEVMPHYFKEKRKDLQKDGEKPAE